MLEGSSWELACIWFGVPSGRNRVIISMRELGFLKGFLMKNTLSRLIHKSPLIAQSCAHTGDKPEGYSSQDAPGGYPVCWLESRARQRRLTAIGTPPWGLVGVCRAPVSLSWTGCAGRRLGSTGTGLRPPASQSACPSVLCGHTRTAEGAPGSSSVGFGH